MTTSKYSALIGGLVALSLTPILAFAPLDAAARRAVALGTGMAALNTIAAHTLATWSLARSPQVFLSAVLGGMVGRMALMLGGVVVAVLAADLPKGPLATSLLAYFVLFLILELSLIQRSTRRRPITP